MNTLNEAEKAFLVKNLGNVREKFTTQGAAIIMVIAEVLNLAPDYVYDLYVEKRKAINEFILNNPT